MYSGVFRKGMKNLQYSLLLTGQILIFGKKILLKEKVTHEKKEKICAFRQLRCRSGG